MQSLYNSFTKKEPLFTLLFVIETEKLDFMLYVYIRLLSLRGALLLTLMKIYTVVATVRKLSQAVYSHCVLTSFSQSQSEHNQGRQLAGKVSPDMDTVVSASLAFTRVISCVQHADSWTCNFYIHSQKQRIIQIIWCISVFNYGRNKDGFDERSLVRTYYFTQLT